MPKKEVSPLEYWNLRKALDEVHDEALNHPDIYNATIVLLEDLKKQIVNIKKEQESEPIASTQVISEVALSTNITIRDPQKAKIKGRPKECTRIPSGKQVSQDETQKRLRCCGVCHEKGHDIRTCPVVKERLKEKV